MTKPAWTPTVAPADTPNSVLWVMLNESLASTVASVKL